MNEAEQTNISALKGILAGIGAVACFDAGNQLLQSAIHHAHRIQYCGFFNDVCRMNNAIESLAKTGAGTVLTVAGVVLVCAAIENFARAVHPVKHN